MNNPRRRNGHQRTKLRKRILNEEDTCYLCSEPVDVTLPPGFDESPEVHEIIPVSKGGDPLDRANTVLTHRACNNAYGNGDKPRPIASTKTAALTPMHTTRKWW